MYNPQNPLIVQSDRTVMLEVDNERYEECRDKLAGFCELIKSPEHIHTYRLTPLSLWNARAAGMSAEEMVEVLEEYAKYDVPGNIVHDMRDYVGPLRAAEALQGRWPPAAARRRQPADDRDAPHQSRSRNICWGRWMRARSEIPLLERGRVKQALLKLGFPVEDLAGYTEGDHLDIRLREVTRSGKPFLPRAYQEQAASRSGPTARSAGGSGVLVLPCGAGKTIIGMQVMAKAQMQTLIIVTGITAAHQWRDEILDKTTLTEEMIGEYSGERKEIKPVTIATYQVLTARRDPNKKRGKKGEEAETTGIRSSTSGTEAVAVRRHAGAGGGLSESRSVQPAQLGHDHL